MLSSRFARPPPGLGWLQRQGSISWVRTLVLDIDGAPGLLLEGPEASSAPAASHAATPPADTTPSEDLPPEEVAFFRHL
ncbi:MAG TPA: hypothetical protein VKA76_00110 [Gammaproteobacteria bacterium]|nr:hypothetical protein [Gammaproteobacteria bacterium]